MVQGACPPPRFTSGAADAAIGGAIGRQGAGEGRRGQHRQPSHHEQHITASRLAEQALHALSWPRGRGAMARGASGVDLRQQGDRGGSAADEELLFADADDGDKALLAELLDFDSSWSLRRRLRRLKSRLARRWMHWMKLLRMRRAESAWSRDGRWQAVARRPTAGRRRSGYVRRRLRLRAGGGRWAAGWREREFFCFLDCCLLMRFG